MWRGPCPHFARMSLISAASDELPFCKTNQKQSLEESFTQIGFSRKRRGAPGWNLPLGISTHRGKKAPLKSFSSYCTTRICCSGAANGTAGPDRARENSPRTLCAEGEGGRKGDRSLERGEEEGCGERDRKTQVRETRREGGAKGKETR